MPAATKTKTKDTYVPRLKQRYDGELRAALKDELELSSIMQVPRKVRVCKRADCGEVLDR